MGGKVDVDITLQHLGQMSYSGNLIESLRAQAVVSRPGRWGIASIEPRAHAPKQKRHRGSTLEMRWTCATVVAVPGLDPGIVPAIHAVGKRVPMTGGWVHIMTNRPNGTLYTGVASDIGRRAYGHRGGLVKGFTKRYSLKCLVYMERYESIVDAIQRESNMKHWPRAWKAH
jgi:putative endonuclease